MATKKNESKATTGKDSEASDLDNPEVVANLSPEGQEAAEQLGDEAKKEADAALDASGPLHLQSPEERVATGAVSEEHAKEQEETINIPEDYTGEVSEAGTPLEATEESKPVQQEDVIDFPPPVGERPGEDPEAPQATAETQAGPKRLYGQKSVFYTDGLSGGGDHNLERAYDIPDILKSSDEEVREAGEESESEAAKADDES